MGAKALEPAFWVPRTDLDLAPEDPTSPQAQDEAALQRVPRSPTPPRVPSARRHLSP